MHTHETKSAQEKKIVFDFRCLFLFDFYGMIFMYDKLVLFKQVFVELILNQLKIFVKEY